MRIPSLDHILYGIIRGIYKNNYYIFNPFCVLNGIVCVYNLLWFDFNVCMRCGRTNRRFGVSRSIARDVLSTVSIRAQFMHSVAFSRRACDFQISQKYTIFYELFGCDELWRNTAIRSKYDEYSIVRTYHEIYKIHETSHFKLDQMYHADEIVHM